MPKSKIDQEIFQKGFLLILVVAISLVFFELVRQFVIAILLAAIFSGMVHPVFRWFERKFKGRSAAASFVTLVLVFFVVLIPMGAFVSVLAAEALEVSRAVAPWIERQLSGTSEIEEWLEQLPYHELFVPYQAEITSRLGEFAGSVGNFLFDGLRAATSGTATFFFQFFIMLYAMFFFIMNGRETLDKILYYMPLSNEDEARMVEKFTSVTRATLKGTMVIGAIQGALAGIGLAFAGIPSVVFWSTVMAVLSLVPALGTAIVWIPAVIYLFAIGDTTPAILLFLWCALVVGTVDNFLRPRLVGKDTKMSDLLVLLSTLGGLAMFGVVGVILGPIIAALFVTIWEIYGLTFEKVLPKTEAQKAAILEAEAAAKAAEAAAARARAEAEKAALEAELAAHEAAMRKEEEGEEKEGGD